MKIAIGNDRTAVKLKTHIKNFLENKGYDVTDFGTSSEERTDYPLYGYKMARAVANKEFDFGILICGTAYTVKKAKEKGIEVINVYSSGQTLSNI